MTIISMTIIAVTVSAFTFINNTNINNLEDYKNSVEYDAQRAKNYGAEDLIRTDPVINAGSLTMELREWYGSAALM